MPVIGHQAVRDQAHRMALQSFVEDREERPIIIGAQEDRMSAQPAIEYVKDRFGSRRA
jgi:hypothetical protein